MRQIRNHTIKELEDWLIQLKGVQGNWACSKRIAIKKYLKSIETKKEVSK